jgi:hypothetical protein
MLPSPAVSVAMATLNGARHLLDRLGHLDLLHGQIAEIEA